MRINTKIIPILGRFRVYDATRRLGVMCLKPRLEIHSFFGMPIRHRFAPGQMSGT